MTPTGLFRIASFLAFPFTLAGVTFLLLAALQALAVRAPQRARLLVSWAAAAVALYTALLVGVSLASTERVLEPGVEKRFCGLDCDLAVSVTGLIPANATAAGARAFYVKLHVRNNGRRALIMPSSMRAWLVSADRHTFDPAGGRGMRFMAPISPGSRVGISIRFEVPAAARDLRVMVTEGGPMTRLLIGDENSFLHRKTELRLPS